KMDVLGRADRVRVDRARHFAAVLAGEAEQVGGEVEPPRRAVALHGDTLFRGDGDELLPARRHLGPVEDLSPRRVTPDAAEGIFERPPDALGLLRLVELEALMHRA